MIKKSNLIKYTGFLARAKLRKGGAKHLSWKAVAAIIEAEMAARQRDFILEDEELCFEKGVVEGICEEI